LADDGDRPNNPQKQEGRPHAVRPDDAPMLHSVSLAARRSAT
jgi:hypothetical protein